MKPILVGLLSLMLTVAIVSAAVGPSFRAVGAEPSTDDPMTGLAAIVFVMLWLAFYYSLLQITWLA